MYRYFGSYKNKKYDGKGLLFNTHTKNFYNGQFKNGDITGYGKLYTRGYMYKGQLRRGRFHGVGILYQLGTGRNLLSIRPLVFERYEKGIYVGNFFRGRFQNGVYIEHDYIDNSYSVFPYHKGKKHGKSLTISYDFIETQIFRDGKKNGEYNYYDNKVRIRTIYKGDTVHGIYEIFSKNHYQQYFFKNGLIQKRSLLSFKYQYNFVIEMKCYDMQNEILSAHHDKQKIKFPVRYLLKYESIPVDFLCPIGHDIMLQPCLTEVGQCYDYKNIKKWFNHCNTLRDPLTNLQLFTSEVEFDIPKKYEILQYLCKKLFPPKQILTILH